MMNKKLFDTYGVLCKKGIKPLMACLFFCVYATTLSAQERSPIYFIYDASGSMWGQMEGKTKMEIASGVLARSVTGLTDGQEVGLVAYGHREKGDCQDVEFLVDLPNEDKTKVARSLKGIKPLGKTPLAYSALQVIDKLEKNKRKATIILITDGIESCGGNICDVVKAAKKKGIDFKLHIIGFGLTDDETGQLKCAAESGDGHYYDAQNSGGLGDVLNEATQSTVDDPEHNFSLYAVKNGAPINANVRADKIGDAAHFYASSKTAKDTAFLYLPPGKYKIKVEPYSSDVRPVTLEYTATSAREMGHRTVSFDGGTLTVGVSRNNGPCRASVSVLEKDSDKNVAYNGTSVQKKSAMFELTPGIYDVAIEALDHGGDGTKRIYEDIEVQAGQNAELEHNFATGTLIVHITDNGKSHDATMGVYSVKSKKESAKGRQTGEKSFELGPGFYDIAITGLYYVGATQKHRFENVEIKAGEVTRAEHDFKSGILRLTSFKDGAGQKSAVSLYRDGKGPEVYRRAISAEPTEISLPPGNYELRINTIALKPELKKTMNVVVKAGETMEHVVKF